MPTIDLTDAELAALTAAIQRLINEDKFPVPGLEPLRHALAKLQEAAPGPLSRTPAAKPGIQKRKTPKGRPRAS